MCTLWQRPGRDRPFSDIPVTLPDVSAGDTWRLSPVRARAPSREPLGVGEGVQLSQEAQAEAKPHRRESSASEHWPLVIGKVRPSSPRRPQFLL